MEKIMAKLHEEYPDAKISLNFKNPYELIVATILSAQSTDARVNIVIPELFKRFPTVRDMAEVGAEEIKPYIKSLGLYNNKAKSLANMAKKVVKDFNGIIPSTMKELTSLPGVGRKTANVVMGNGFGIVDSGITVDTHVTRICNRLGIVSESNAVKIERELMKIVPNGKWVIFTHLMIEHGRKICVRKPKCDECIINTQCLKKLDYKK